MSQNHRSHCPQCTVAGRLHGSSVGETPWHARSEAVSCSVLSSIVVSAGTRGQYPRLAAMPLRGARIAPIAAKRRPPVASVIPSEARYGFPSSGFCSMNLLFAGRRCPGSVCERSYLRPFDGYLSRDPSQDLPRSILENVLFPKWNRTFRLTLLYFNDILPLLFLQRSHPATTYESASDRLNWSWPRQPIYRTDRKSAGCGFKRTLRLT